MAVNYSKLRELPRRHCIIGESYVDETVNYTANKKNNVWIKGNYRLALDVPIAKG